MANPILIGLTSGGAFLLAFLLLKHPKNSNMIANRWLSLFVATLAAAVLGMFLNQLNLQTDYWRLLMMIEVSGFLTAPALFLSIQSFTTPSRKIKKKDPLHFALAGAFLLFSTKLLWTGTNIEFQNELISRLVLTMIGLALPVQTLFYLFLSFKRLIQHKHNIRQVSSSTEAVDLSWLKYLLFVWTVVMFFWFNLAFFNFAPLYEYTPILYLAALYFISYFSLNQGEVYAFAPAQLRELEPVISGNQNDRSDKQKRLTDSQLLFLKDKLEHLMEHEKAYSDNELSLPTLAQRVGITAHDLSYLINEVYDENFYAFVNRHRVEEAKRILLSEQLDKINMLGIAYQAGFNSKTTFYTAFKKHTGLTPTAFLESTTRPKQAQKA